MRHILSILVVLIPELVRTELSSLPVLPLPKLNLYLHETSVSGFSSGSFFATQFHIAHSSFIVGAGLISGGPYACVKHHPMLLNCLGVFPKLFPLDVSTLVNEVFQQQLNGNIDPVDNIKRQRLYVYSGINDPVITNSVSKKLVTFYQNHLALPWNVQFEQADGLHRFPVNSSALGRSCKRSNKFYKSSCQLDGAEHILSHIYGPLKAPNTGRPDGAFIRFSQQHLHQHPKNIGLADHGFLYVPRVCREKRCKLHIVFHGCQQPETYPGSVAFIENSGYTRWADTNRIVLAYPQTVSKRIPNKQEVDTKRFHPGSLFACWDMFGMYDVNYFNKNGLQIQAIRKLIDLLVN